MHLSWLSSLRRFLDHRFKNLETQKILANMGWLLADRVLRVFVSLLLGAWVARYLGPEQFGKLNYAIALVSLFSVFATLGLEEIVIRDLVAYPQKKDKIINTCLSLRLVSTLTSIGVISLILSLIHSGDILLQKVIFLVSLILIPQIIIDTIDLWFKSQVNSKYSVIIKDICLIFSSLAKVILLLYKAPLPAFIGVILCEVTVSALALVWLYSWQSNRISPKVIDFSIARRLIKDGWPMIFSGLAVVIYTRVDQVMLGILAGHGALGLYSAATKVSEAWNFIPIIVVSSLYPKIVASRQGDDSGFYRNIQRLYNLMVVLSYGVVLFFTLFSGVLVSLIYGAQYTDTARILPILMGTSLFSSLGMARSSFLMTMNWATLQLATVSIACLINVGLNYLLIPRHGGYGAAVATLLSQGLAVYGLCFCFPRLRQTAKMMTRAIALSWLFRSAPT
jgi:O-antigen/teichoic acid export membrane protein